MDKSQPVSSVGRRIRCSACRDSGSGNPAGELGSFFYRHGCNNRMEATRLYGSDFGVPASLDGRTLMISSGATPRNLASSRT